MSASGELRAIDDAANAYPFGRDNDLHGEPLLYALPEIEKVVDQMEAFAEILERSVDPWKEIQERLRNVVPEQLAELERKLVSWKE